MSPMTFWQNPSIFLQWSAALLLALTCHEFAHAFLATRLGDPTPKTLGRLSLNPLRHLDPLGTLFLFVLGFGWGKPVPFSPHLLPQPKLGIALVSLAGIAVNFLLALLAGFLLRLLPSPPLFLEFFLLLNLMLGLFNLLPVAPLDGYKIALGALPTSLTPLWLSLEAYGPLFLLVLILPTGNGSLLSQFLSPILDFILTLLLG